MAIKPEPSEFIRLATSKKWMRRSLECGNLPPRTSVLTDPDVLDRFGWAPVMAQALKAARLEPRETFWPCSEWQLHSGISSCCWVKRQRRWPRTVSSPTGNEPCVERA
jgi:hypothetical protein